MSEEIKQRTIAKPLIEERMFLSDTGELLISRLTGHISVADEKSFHSATKDIETRYESYSKEIKNYEEKIARLEQDVNINDNDLLDPNNDIKDFESLITKMEKDLNDLITKLPEYEDFIKEFNDTGIENLINENELQSIDIDELVTYFMDTYLISQKELELIVQNIDCRTKEAEYLYAYIQKQRGEATRLRNELVTRHNNNQAVYDTLVDIGPSNSTDQNTYNGFVNHLNNLYANLKNEFPGISLG